MCAQLRGQQTGVPGDLCKSMKVCVCERERERALPTLINETLCPVFVSVSARAGLLNSASVLVNENIQTQLPGCGVSGWECAGSGSRAWPASGGQVCEHLAHSGSSWSDWAVSAGEPRGRPWWLPVSLGPFRIILTRPTWLTGAGRLSPSRQDCCACLAVAFDPCLCVWICPMSLQRRLRKKGENVLEERNVFWSRSLHPPQSRAR